MEALFRAYFVEGKNIGDLKTLTHVAAEAGLDRTETEHFLASEKGVAEVKAEEASRSSVGHSRGTLFRSQRPYLQSPARSLQISLCRPFSRPRKQSWRVRRRHNGSPSLWV